MDFQLLSVMTPIQSFEEKILFIFDTSLCCDISHEEEKIVHVTHLC
jgi:hypothetical protein